MIKAIPMVTRSSSARRPAPLRTRYTNRLSPDSRGQWRNTKRPNASLSSRALSPHHAVAAASWRHAVAEGLTDTHRQT